MYLSQAIQRRVLASMITTLLAAAGLASAQSAELHPGELAGEVSFSGETVTNVWISAYSTTGLSDG